MIELKALNMQKSTMQRRKKKEIFDIIIIIIIILKRPDLVSDNNIMLFERECALWRLEATTPPTIKKVCRLKNSCFIER